MQSAADIATGFFATDMAAVDERLHSAWRPVADALASRRGA